MARITPARAGKTWHRLSAPGSVEDHPRSCGKDKILLKRKSLLLGSPPLVRERPKKGFISDMDGGITPARAGKTQ